MIEVLVMLAALPFVALADWFGFIRGLPPLQAELTRASHGVVMMLGAGWLATQGSPDYPVYILPFLAFLGIWGGFWLAVGAARARYYRDHHLLGRAAAKVVLAATIWLVATSWQPPHSLWQYLGAQAGMLVAAWCAITGVTKIILLLRPLPHMAVEGVDPMPHGHSDFSDGKGLQ